jgi:hypothetical protein
MVHQSESDLGEGDIGVQKGSQQQNELQCSPNLTSFCCCLEGRLEGLRVGREKNRPGILKWAASTRMSPRFYKTPEWLQARFRGAQSAARRRRRRDFSELSERNKNCGYLWISDRFLEYLQAESRETKKRTWRKRVLIMGCQKANGNADFVRNNLE